MVFVRKLWSSDYESLIEIAESLPQWFTKNGLDHMHIDLKLQLGFTAVQNDIIVGFLSYFTNEGIAHIGWMGVLFTHHRQGIGRRLAEALITELRKYNVRKLRVNTLGDSVDYKPYARTRAFYRGIGFRDHERFEQDDPECPEQLILEMDIE